MVSPVVRAEKLDEMRMIVIAETVECADFFSECFDSLVIGMFEFLYREIWITLDRLSLVVRRVPSLQLKRLSQIVR